MVRNTLNRLAFTMIELIFAIVLIGIAVVSLPMMTVATSKGLESNIVQEAIFAASAELMGASSGYWDENSMQDFARSNLSRVIDIGGDCENDSSNPRYRLRDGHIAQPLHRRCLDDSTTGATDVSDGGFVDLDDSEDLAEKDIFLDTTGATVDAERTGYKEIYKSKITVSQNIANIKDIDITVTGRDKDGDSVRDTIVVLKMQSTNIGEIDYFKRRF